MTLNEYCVNNVLIPASISSSKFVVHMFLTLLLINKFARQ